MINKRWFLSFDWLLIGPVIVLIILSLSTLYSINLSLFKNQFIFFIFSLIAYLFFSNFNHNLTKLYSIHFYIASIFTLFSVLLIGIESKGAVRWIEIFGIHIQFSEIIKPFIAISLASYLSENLLSVKTFFKIILLAIPILTLIQLQPDLGNTIIYLFMLIFTLLVSGFPLILFFLGIVISAIMSPLIFNFLHDYQKRRILTFFNPTMDPQGSSYNVIQSIIAVGSGMFFGKGLSETTQSGLKFLPERHTDFIFASISEGLGFLGASIMLICFCLLLYRIYVIFKSTTDNFSCFFASSVFAFILAQFFINIGMNIGVIPVVGITLPFVSYGGSSLLSNFILLGLLSSIHKVSRDNNILEIK